MKKDFYIGQPLIIKETGEKVNFAYDEGYAGISSSCSVLKKGGRYLEFCDYEDLEPSTEFKFSELMAGLEQGYFEVGTEFRRLPTGKVLTVKQSFNRPYLQGARELPSLSSSYIHSTWKLVGDRKEMTLDEVEAELGYKIKLKNYA